MPRGLPAGTDRLAQAVDAPRTTRSPRVQTTLADAPPDLGAIISGAILQSRRCSGQQTKKRTTRASTEIALNP
jgi:hypothetical protein